MGSQLRVLLIGDVVGRPGRNVVKRLLPQWRQSGRVDYVICNGENSAGGKGITSETARELFTAGVDVITSGNHIWRNRDVFKFIDSEPRLLRPLNYPEEPDIPGQGIGVFELPEQGVRIGVMNLLGRVLMDPMDCPFHAAQHYLPHLLEQTPIVFVDFHAEATSEKVAMGWFLDGQVSCVYGTHTHVLTADERLLHHGTAYITDIGMTGAYDSVIGVTVPPVIDHFLKRMPVRHEVAEQNVKLSGAIVTVDGSSGRALAIERVLESLPSA